MEAYNFRFVVLGVWIFFTSAQSQGIKTGDINELSVIGVPDPSLINLKAEQTEAIQKYLQQEAKENRINPNLLKNKVVALDLYNLTKDCERDFTRYQDELGKIVGTAMWAVKMSDSDGKMADGILDGHTKWEGSYQECIAVMEQPNDTSIVPIQGQYCIATWFAAIPNAISLKRQNGICIPQTCTEEDAKYLFDNVYHAVKLFSGSSTVRCVHDKALNAEAIITIVILCVFGFMIAMGTMYEWAERSRSGTPGDEEDAKPKQNAAHAIYEASNGAPSGTGNGAVEMQAVCEQEDRASREANIYILKLQQQSGKDFSEGYVTDNATFDSPEPNAQHKSKSTIFSEAIEKHGFNDVAVKLLKCFSLVTILPGLLSAESPKGTYRCLNGIRVLAMMFVILGHTYVLGPLRENTPENVYAFVSGAVKDWKKYKLFSLTVYVDTFLILSGFLVTISFLRKLNKSSGKLTIGGMALHYFHRYWRLTPSLMIVLMIYTNLYHYFGKGPFMVDYIGDTDGCAGTWWKNMLYVNNIWPPDDPGCMGWTWYLAVDFQMYVIAPLFIYVFYIMSILLALDTNDFASSNICLSMLNKIAGLVFTILGFCGGEIANIVLWHKYYYPQEGEDTVAQFNDIYVPTWTRCPLYFMGILLGYLFSHTNAKVKMPKFAVAIGWFVGISMYLVVSYAQYTTACTGSSICGPWTKAGLVAWNSLVRPMWGIWVCWLIWACSTGYGGVVNTFLSWNFFFPLAKISYMGYLIHPIFCYLYFDGAPTQFYATDYFFVYLYMANLLIVNLLALVMTAVFTVPLIGIAAVILNGKK